MRASDCFDSRQGLSTEQDDSPPAGITLDEMETDTWRDIDNRSEADSFDPFEDYLESIEGLDMDPPGEGASMRERAEYLDYQLDIVDADDSAFDPSLQLLGPTQRYSDGANNCTYV